MGKFNVIQVWKILKYYFLDKFFPSSPPPPPISIFGTPFIRILVLAWLLHFFNLTFSVFHPFLLFSCVFSQYSLPVLPLIFKKISSIFLISQSSFYFLSSEWILSIYYYFLKHSLLKVALCFCVCRAFASPWHPGDLACIMVGHTDRDGTSDTYILVQPPAVFLGTWPDR